MKRSLFAVFVVLVASPLFAVCTINLPTQFHDGPHTVSWTAVPGANQYYIDYSNDAFVTTTRVPLGSNATFFDLQRTLSFPIDYSFRVTALKDGDADFLCTGTTTRFFGLDFDFRKAVTRTIVPIVATIAGANGSQFKTSLRLTATTTLVGKGKLIFHPAGVSGTDNDKSITYAFSHDGESIVYDDIVAAFGATGVGSIDIVPLSATLNDPTNRSDYVPIAEAHLYNQTANGTFGSFEHHVQPVDFFTSNEIRAHASETGQYRVNIGFRTISTSTMNFDVYDKNGDVRLHRSFTYPPNYTLLTTPDELLGTSLAPGESLAIAPERGSFAIPFYTYTDNGTNDPTIFMPEFQVRSNLGPYDVSGVVKIQ
jgi:hypothetical protein